MEMVRFELMIKKNISKRFNSKTKLNIIVFLLLKYIFVFVEKVFEYFSYVQGFGEKQYLDSHVSSEELLLFLLLK